MTAVLTATQVLSPAAPAPLLLGIDIVDLERIRRALAGTAGVWARQVCTPAERTAVQDDPILAAACIAVKECLVKAVGGRPSPFDWHDLTLDLDAARPVDRSRPVLLAGLGEVAAQALAEVVGPAAGAVFTAPCAVHGPAHAAALRRLYPSPVEHFPPAHFPPDHSPSDHRPTRLGGSAVWASDGHRLVAAAVLHHVPNTSGKAPTP